MKNKELIQQLQRYPQDAEIFLVSDLGIGEVNYIRVNRVRKKLSVGDKFHAPMNYWEVIVAGENNSDAILGIFIE